MELTDSGDELRDHKLPSDSRSGLGIDLNEIPSPSSFQETLPDSIDIVRAYHENPAPPPGGPARIPRDARGSVCGTCGKPESVRNHVVVCDGCERVFHLGCAGMRGRQVSNIDEWVCGECVTSGVKSKRWPLGVKSKHLLDINASPPSDADGEGSEEMLDSRRHTLGDNSFGTNPFGAPVTYSNLYNGGAFGFQKVSEVVTHAVRVGFDEVLNQTQSLTRGFEEVGMNFPLGRYRNSKTTAIGLPSPSPSELFLKALRDFISERQGVLEDGWRVEFRQPMGSSELYAVYCAPDGKMFDSVYEVACYLGLMPGYNSVESEVRKERSISSLGGSHLTRKRKSGRLPVVNGFGEKRGNFSSSLKDPSSDAVSAECANACGNTSEATIIGRKEDDHSGPQQSADGLPLQFEDFFVLSLGKVDDRSSYYDVNIIWPIGYKSCWHDRITGSLFTCEVLDGGDSGPIFRVRRCSCSDSSIPVGSTILSMSNLCQFVSQTNEGEKIMNDSMEWDGDESIQMILSDPCMPTENDVMSCLESCSNARDSHSSDILLPFGGSVKDRTQNLLSNDLGLIDEIGEILVEEHSSSSAWRDISQKVVNACVEICKQKGTLKFYCKHVENETCFHKWDIRNCKSEILLNSLAKFFGSPAVSIPAVIYVDNDLESLYDVLRKWLEQDRFGLDVEFVQEVLEPLPGIQGVSQYEFLNNRSNSSSFPTVGNGFLVADWRVGSQNQEETEQGLYYRMAKKVKLANECMKEDPCPPPGNPLCSGVPCELVGDVFQAWELLCRFHEVLGLKELLSLHELEKELINPWFNGSVFNEKHESDGSGGPILAPRCEAGPSVPLESPHAFIQVETEAMKEAAEVKLASFTYTRCFGASLTKAHNSLLEVLIGELQSKVAALVDPNFDPGETRTRRGRRKDVDGTVPARRAKLNMLPINELTWPELARRYILAVLSMDGNLDSPEITARESGKVFRCLQGDGGLLCGSLSGVAGMEADALLLAEATKKIFGSLSRDNDVLTMEDVEIEAKDAGEKTLADNGNIPEWAQMLEPVRKLPTNVGTRIRKCVWDALSKGPPEWAREKLEHSISKEVYKGNASGPTKKAVLSVLAEISAKLQPKPTKERRKKTVISFSDIIMKQCRIVLRQAAAADDGKVFCNLLGRKLINYSDNDDEGLLGSPAMVSRPLDFRTIDLRLAAGAYCGSHEAFLEDVHELWNHVGIAFGDQPDLVELAEKLSQNFEMLYNEEVVTYAQRFVEYAKVECLSEEMRKEVERLLASTSEIPKAPWDEGVCKVCGIDRDDDSVLLCDTCDAEYHTYCLNPPLARIPEGNWYCPSCVDGKHAVQDVSECTKLIGKHRSKKFQGEATSYYLEALTCLLSVMEEKEYWEYSVGERTVLLKFLCDELLNSSLVRQHLEQCAELSAESHQKLRSLTAEWKTLKIKEDILSNKAAKMDACSLVAGEVGLKEGLTGSLSNPGKCLVQPHTASDSPNNFGVFADSLCSEDISKDKIRFNSVDKSVSATNSETDSQNMNSINIEGPQKSVCAALDGCQLPTNLLSCVDSQCGEKSNKSFSISSNMPQEINSSDGAANIQGNQQKCEGRDTFADQQGQSINFDVPKCAVNESEPYHLELNAVRHDISVLQDSINSVESQLLKLSVRRDFLGIDSLGRLYWVSMMPGGCPCLVVDSSAPVLHGRRRINSRDPVDKFSGVRNCQISGKSTYQMLGVMKDLPPLISLPSNTASFSSPWVAYQTDAEIEELLGWLKDSNPKERELKESIMIWQKSRFKNFIHPENEDQVEHQEPNSMPGDREETVSNSLVTKATSLLEKKYGPFFEPGTPEVSKKRGKKATTNIEKLYRCECLEPIWPSRHHCMSCHKTLLNDDELEVHNDGKCSAGLPPSEKNTNISGFSKRTGNVKFETTCVKVRGDADTGGTSTSRCSELNSRLIMFSNKESACPFNFEDICSKFVINDSVKEIVKEIGLIDLGGIPSFVPSVSPYVSDSTVTLMSTKKDDAVADANESKASRGLGPQGNEGTATCHDDISSISTGSSIACKNNKAAKSSRSNLGGSEQKDGNFLFCSPASPMGVDGFCVVPLSSLRPLVGKVSHILRQLKISLLDIDAALPEVALRPSRSSLERRQAWHAFVKSAQTIYEMVQATITLEDMIKTQYLRNDWWYWSSLSAAAKSSTLSSLALRIYSLDSAILYEKVSCSCFTDSCEHSVASEQKAPATLDVEKSKASRKSSRKRKEPDG